MRVRARQMAEIQYDVAIIGGGLAGLTLALQLHREQPALSIIVLERSSLPPPHASHKVGESTVEIGAHYLADKLELGDLLERTHLRKFGLRLFFGAGKHDDLADADELGASRLLPAISYQIDRGKLEGDLVALLAEYGVTVLDQCVARSANISANGQAHSLSLVRAGESQLLNARWVVDASARAAVLKRKLGISKESSHKIGSAWFRLDLPLSVDEWSASDAWRRQCCKPRRLSTNHLMGPGYWVWIIPLSGNRTSVGLVADPAEHPLSTFNSFDKLCSWLHVHQPRLATEVSDARPALMDFGFMKDLARDSQQLWSRQRWALTGESGLFSDPFYSPGSDFIGISNTLIADLISREADGEQFPAHAAVYQQMYRSFYESTMSLYEHQYTGFGDTRLMVTKTTWDYAYYWSVLSWLYFRGVMTDIDFLRDIQSGLIAMRQLNMTMQKSFRARAAERHEDEGRGRFFDQTAIPVLYDLNAALLEPTTNRRHEFEQNCDLLERLSPMLLKLLAGDSASGHCHLLGDLRQRFR